MVDPNGMGKTTLFKMIVGQRRDCARGARETFVYRSGSGLLVLDKTVREEIPSGRDAFQLGNAEVNLRGYRSTFTVSGDD